MGRIVVSSLDDVDLSGIKIPMVVVYKHPSDAPDWYVGRIWEGAVPAPTNVEIRAKTLQKCRAAIKRGKRTYAILPRAADDDPVIMETWVLSEIIVN